MVGGMTDKIVMDRYYKIYDKMISRREREREREKLINFAGCISL